MGEGEAGGDVRGRVPSNDTFQFWANCHFVKHEFECGFYSQEYTWAPEVRLCTRTSHTQDKRSLRMRWGDRAIGRIVPSGPRSPALTSPGVRLGSLSTRTGDHDGNVSETIKLIAEDKRSEYVKLTWSRGRRASRATSNASLLGCWQDASVTFEKLPQSLFRA